MRIRFRWIVAIVVLLPIGTLEVLDLMNPSPSIPPLLRNVRAAGGNWGACPHPPPRMNTEALSPELNERLSKEFPPGTNQDYLVETLTSQGFIITDNCKDDNSIHRAVLSLYKIGISEKFPIVSAEIGWKADQDHRIVWTKGYVSWPSI